MNIMNKVTIACLKKNKKRTIVTIIGVIISVAMIAAVSCIGQSFQDVMIRNTIYHSGDFDVAYHGVSKENVSIIQKDANIQKSMRVAFQGFAKMDANKNKNIPYINLYAYDMDTIELAPIHLKEGTLPKSNNEVLVSERMLKTSEAKVKVGDIITLRMGDRYQMIEGKKTKVSPNDTFLPEETFEETRTQVYKVSGICKSEDLDVNEPGYLMFLPVKGNEDILKGKLSVYTKMKNVDSASMNRISFLEADAKAESSTMNNDKMMYSGNYYDSYLSFTIFLAMFIVGSIILIGSVSLIYNAFTISLSERSRYLGMLSSVGATKQQKRNSVFFEAFLIGIIAIPIGVLSGYAGIGITFYLLSNIVENLFNVAVPLQLMVTWQSILGTILFSVFILFVSAWKPARKASQISAITAIRQHSDITIRKRDIQTSRLTRRIFGFEAELALKNMKRNKHRYLATLFSLIICIVLYLSASTFALYMKTAYTMTQSDENYDADVITNYYEDTINKDIMKALLEVPSASSVVMYRSNPYSFMNGTLPYTKDIKAYFKDFGDQNEVTTVNILRVDDQTFTDYLKKINASSSDYKQREAQFVLVNQITVRYGADQESNIKHNYKTMKLFEVNDGDPIGINMYRGESLETFPINIAKVASEYPDFMGQGPQNVTATLITNEYNYKLLKKEVQTKGLSLNDHQMSTFLYKGNDSHAIENDVTEISNTKSIEHINSMNIKALSEERSQTTIFISTFLYGFVALIILVCTANIFNTISTSVALRKREFAMLKSIGITPKKFNKMIRFESLFYGLKAIIYGLPISGIFLLCLHVIMLRNFNPGFMIPWSSIGFAIIGIFIIVTLTMLYAIHKIRHDNIVETIKNESI